MAIDAPWLAVAGLGALHGLNPASGWILAAAAGVHAGERRRALRALAPIAAGHAASVALVAAAIEFGLSMDRPRVQAFAGGLLVVVVLGHLAGCTAMRSRPKASPVGLALWSFMMSTGHGAGAMLVPALAPLCVGGTSAPGITASGPLVPALVMAGVHAAAMLAVTGAVAASACCAAPAATDLLRRAVRHSGGRARGRARAIPRDATGDRVAQGPGHLPGESAGPTGQGGLRNRKEPGGRARVKMTALNPPVPDSHRDRHAESLLDRLLPLRLRP
jgi:hypothetical protein